MAKETIAELQARNNKLEKDIIALSAKDDVVSKSELRAARAEQREIQAQIELVSATEKNTALEASETSRKTKEAKAAVARMVAGKGAVLIAARDIKSQEDWEAKFVSDSSLIPLMAGSESTPASAPLQGRTTPGAASQEISGVRTTSDMRGGIKAIAELSARSGRDSLMVNKFAAALDVAAIYAREIRPALEKGVTTFELQAGEAKDTLGTLAAALVSQRTLDLYKFEFPMLGSITTDFSDQAAQFNQTTTTRIIVVPAVISYDATLGADGRPAGYVVVTPAQTVDAPITLNKHRAVDIIFDANVLASTQRRLFEEMGPAAAYALGKDVVDSLYAVITAANYTTNAAFSIAAINYGRPTFSKAKRILNLQGVPYTNRFALSSSIYQEMLEQDPTLVSLAVFQKPEIITDSELPQIARFRPIEAPNLPATAIGAKTLQAFFAHKSALLMQARIPNDWNTVIGPGQGYGTVNVVTNPDTGLSVLMVQFSNPQSAHAEFRLALMYGVAKGNEKGGQIVTD